MALRLEDRLTSSVWMRATPPKRLRRSPSRFGASNAVTRLSPGRVRSFIREETRRCAGMGAFALPARLWTDLWWVISRLLRARLCIANFRSRLGGGDRFDDWVVGRQFVPDCLHHLVSANRTFPIRRRIGRFCGDFRPLTCGTLVSVGAHV